MLVYIRRGKITSNDEFLNEILIFLATRSQPRPLDRHSGMQSRTCYRAGGH